MKHSKHLPPVLLGFTFLLSGWLKGVDPYGTSLKLEKYFRIWGWNGFWTEHSLAWAICLCAGELFLGLLLCFGAFRKMTGYIAAGVMAGFTALACWLAFSFTGAAVQECGCFGEALPLSHDATLVKNIALLGLALWVCHAARKEPLLPRRMQGKWTMLFALLFSLSVPLYSAIFLPPVDFLPYNRGTNLAGHGGFSVFNPRYEEVTDSVLQLSFTRPLVAVVAREPLTADDRKKLESFKRLEENRQVALAFWAIPGMEADGLPSPCYADEVTLKSLLRTGKGFIVIEDGIIRAKRNLSAYVPARRGETDTIQQLTAWDSWLLLRYIICLLAGLAAIVWIWKKEKDGYIQ